MMQETPNEAGQVQEIQKQINQALEELDRIRNQRQPITTPAELQAAEQAIIDPRAAEGKGFAFSCLRMGRGIR
ncbi:MAG: hypothetical protein U5R30_13560 [Deltaproteobacteria bacterium]|nr:hypothetical protein [Deltaproteobacteria bacterium]